MSKDKEFLSQGELLNALPFPATYAWLAAKAADPDFPRAERVSARKTLYRRDEVERWLSKFERKTTVEGAKDGGKGTPSKGRRAK